LSRQPKQDSSWDTDFLCQSSYDGPDMSKGSNSNSSERGSRDSSILWPSYSQPGALLSTASNIFLCGPEIACCSCSSGHESQDISLLWLSYSQPEALLPTASNVFLCGPEIAYCSCSCSSTDEIIRDIVQHSSKQQLLVARRHIAMQPAGKRIIYTQHRCFGCACRDEAWSRAGWPTLRRLDGASGFTNMECRL
jgi:hypothetical protein